ncbi:MAG: 3-isopropylmalate dehydrogenase [Candidatus Marinimicrobia bacterium]|nr:3-isopropylmalate dehydrogenase [Candidatus Neomarinimicrobiota bacterium]
MRFAVTILPGDGIGPEVMDVGVGIMVHVAQGYGLLLDLTTKQVGGASLDACGLPITDDTLEACYGAQAVLLGAVGGPRWEGLPHDKKPERALLRLREALGLYTNLRPARVYPALVEASSLRPEVVRDTDLLVVRELTGGIYFGKPRGYDHDHGWNTLVYTRDEVERIARVAFQQADLRRKHVTCVDKANVLESSQFWREIVHEVHRDYPHIELVDLYVDNAAMQLVRNPGQFDVLLTQNMFGDILSDVASVVTGSLGMLPSASIGDEHALYEPVHGSAPDIAGQNTANPLAMIASVAMMFATSFNLPEAAHLLEQAIEGTLSAGYRTADIATPGATVLSTSDMGAQVQEAFDHLVQTQPVSPTSGLVESE